MFYKVEASFILAHLLKTNSYCTISKLVKVKNAIEESIPSVFVDVSRSSILCSIESFPEIFELRDNKILRKESSSVFFEESVIEYFDFGLKDSIKAEMASFLEMEDV